MEKNLIKNKLNSKSGKNIIYGSKNSVLNMSSKNLKSGVNNNLSSSKKKMKNNFNNLNLNHMNYDTQEDEDDFRISMNLGSNNISSMLKSARGTREDPILMRLELLNLNSPSEKTKEDLYSSTIQSHRRTHSSNNFFN
jgi:hypothetical protein